MNGSSSIDLSIIIISFNEARRIERCLTSLPPGCEIILLDSGSTDQTQAIAKRFGAKVFERPFDDYASQRNAALTHASKAWVFFVDADEELSGELRAALCRWLPQNQDSYFAVRRRLRFMNRLMSFGKSSDNPVRIGPRELVRFEGRVHEQMVPVRPLHLRSLSSGYLLHHSYEDLTDYFEKFNHYTSKIAEQKYAGGVTIRSGWQVAVRPWWEFFNRFFLRLGFLDGYPGYCYALVSSLYGFVKYAKYRELVERSVGNEKV
jgi:glycosyltransferase involved in cell wall biosynthesis